MSRQQSLFTFQGKKIDSSEIKIKAKALAAPPLAEGETIEIAISGTARAFNYERRDGRLVVTATVEVVYNFRMSLLDAIHVANVHEIYNGNLDGYRERFRRFESVSYHRMVLQFWCTPASFYGDLNWIHPRIPETHR